MTHLFKTAALVILAAALFLAPAGAAENGEKGIELDFSLPGDAAAASYLGLKSQGPFTLDQVDADILIVEIFSMYCPICQREATRVNQLFEKLAGVKDRKIRLLGIGAGNSAFEVNFFKETYAIPFPVFSDDDFTIHKKIGERGTPFFIAMKPGAPKGKQIFFTHSGDIGDLDRLFDQLTRPGN